MTWSHYAGIKSNNCLGHRGNFQTVMLVPYLLVTQLTTMMQKHFLTSSHSASAGGIVFFFISVMVRSFCFNNWTLRLFVTSIIMDNSLRTLWYLWSFFNTLTPNPFLHPTNNVGHVYSHFSLSFNIAKGERKENCHKISKAWTVSWEQLEIKENYEYCSTFPTTLNLSRVIWILGFMTTVFSPFIPRLLSILDTIR